MAEASPSTVAGRFDGTTFTHGGITSTFFQRDGKFFVRTDGADGQPGDFEIAYTFGVAPLQQYLIAQPNGRLQALSIAWDTRSASDGGQRWFHLYPDDVPAAGDPLHWTGRLQNWNFMCADCHSTAVRKGYDQATRTFQTTWSEISVGCESCHGPGSTHVEQARAGTHTDGYGLAARLLERRGATWSFDRAAGVPVRSHARTTDIEVETCARCHSRREQVTDRWDAGDPFENGFRPSSVTTPLYHVDGQQRDEVYTYGSFLQSRMYAKGVTCSDCHNPHSGTLRFPGNATCTQCHQDPRYDSAAHHLHQSGSTGASCIACHMPPTTYMQVDPRHDHAFKVPRPQLSAEYGVPNACTTCHTSRTPSWAIAQIAGISMGRASVASPAAAAFGAAEQGTPTAGQLLRQIAFDRSVPAITRAGALARLAAGPDASGTQLDGLVGDASPLVRRAALGALRGLDDATRLRLAAPLLADPIRTVRVEAAQSVMDLADRALTGADRDRFEAAFAEWIAEQQFNADRPEAQVNLGSAWMARGRFQEAVAAFRESIALDPSFEPAYVNLAETHRALGAEALAFQVLSDAAARHPESAAIRHSLGLAFVRQRRLAEAIDELGQAARLEPGSARYAYVHAVALNDAGRGDEAMEVLRRTLVAHPDDIEVLMAAALYSERGNRVTEARAYANRLLRLRPRDPGVRDLALRVGADAAR
jgi:tetratricopeptide (TPR) repeat protein